VESKTVNAEPTIAVWGHYHGGNIGDELVVRTIVTAIRRRLPRARILGISMSPADTRERHGIDAYPINPDSAAAPTAAAIRAKTPARPRPPRSGVRGALKRIPGVAGLRALPRRLGAVSREPAFLWRSYRALRDVDRIVVAGSGQLLDEWRGPWLHPYTTFRWALLARLARVPVAYPSVGAGPIDAKLSAFFIRSAVRSADFVSVRDAHSGDVLRSIGLDRPFRVCPDMGYALPDELLQGGASSAPAPGEGPVVGLNAMAHQDPRYWPRGDARRYEAYLDKLTAFTRWLLDEGYTVRMFSSQPRSDSRVVDDLVRLLRETGEVGPERFQVMLGDIQTVDELVGVICGCDRIVAARYHSVLLPLLLDIPVVGLAYNPKTSELLAGAGRPEQCLDIDAFDVESLVAAFRDLSRAEEPEARAALRERVAEHRTSVEEQFDALFGALHDAARFDLEASRR
jgi:polysaccharide pyruvyl transferase WcaK-like protein